MTDVGEVKIRVTADLDDFKKQILDLKKSMPSFTAVGGGGGGSASTSSWQKSTIIIQQKVDKQLADNAKKAMREIEKSMKSQFESMGLGKEKAKTSGFVKLFEDALAGIAGTARLRGPLAYGIGVAGKTLGVAAPIIGALILLKDTLETGFGVLFKVLGVIMKLLGLLIMPVVNLLIPLLLPILWMLGPIVKLVSVILKPVYKLLMDMIKSAKESGIVGLDLAMFGMLLGIGLIKGVMAAADTLGPLITKLGMAALTVMAGSFAGRMLGTAVGGKTGGDVGASLGGVGGALFSAAPVVDEMTKLILSAAALKFALGGISFSTLTFTLVGLGKSLAAGIALWSGGIATSISGLGSAIGLAITASPLGALIGGAIFAAILAYMLKDNPLIKAAADALQKATYPLALEITNALQRVLPSVFGKLPEGADKGTMSSTIADVVYNLLHLAPITMSLRTPLSAEAPAKALGDTLKTTNDSMCLMSDTAKYVATSSFTTLSGTALSSSEALEMFEKQTGEMGATMDDLNANAVAFSQFLLTGSGLNAYATNSASKYAGAGGSLNLNIGPGSSRIKDQWYDAAGNPVSGDPRGGAPESLGLGDRDVGSWGDFIQRPGQAPVSFSSSDTIVGFKAGSGGGGININIPVQGILNDDLKRKIVELVDRRLSEKMRGVA